MSRFIYCCSENTEEHREGIRVAEYLWMANQFPSPHCRVIFLQLGKKFALILSCWFKKTPSFQSYLPFCLSFQERILLGSLEIRIQEECCDFWVPFWSAYVSVLFFLVLQLKQYIESLDLLPFLKKAFMTFSFPPGYQICMPPSSPLFSLRLQISSSVFHFCPYPWCIKFRDSSTISN